MLLIGLIAYMLYIRGKIRLVTLLSLPILAFYLSFVATITIISRQATFNPQYKLMLFWSYQAIASGEVDLTSQVLWNIVLFIPIGILLMLVLTCKYKWIIALVCGVILSSIIEVIQLITHRGLFEFDDIVHNSLGAMIGIGVYVVVLSLVKRLKRKKNN